MKKSWKNQENIQNKSWKNQEKIIKTSRKSYETIMKQSWKNHSKSFKNHWKIRKKRASRCSQKLIFQKTTFQRTKERQRHSFWLDAFPPNSESTPSHPTLTTYVLSHFAAWNRKGKEQTEKSRSVQEQKCACRCSEKHIFEKHAPKATKNHYTICEKIIKESTRNHAQFIDKP